tara:strand:+ start:6588 stop:7658 length:1071 start_codon:yes stop_codon:yes gene_type:complete
MRSKHQILQEKLDGLLNNNQHIMDVVEKIDHDVNKMEDAIVPFGPMSKMRFYSNGEFNVMMGGEKYELHSNALNQLSYQFGIPASYSKKLMQTKWGRDLLQDVFTQHNDNSSRTKMLVRSVDNEIRGIVSDKYRRLDSRIIYERFLSVAKQNGAVPIQAHYTKVKQYMTVVFPRVFEINTENNGTVYTAFGARIVNGDYGNSALHLNSFMMQCVCTNGLVGTSALNVKHLGKRLSPDLKLSQRTYDLDTKTMASSVYDITKSLLSEEVMLKNVAKMKSASNEIIDMDMAIKKLPKEIHKEEIKGIQTILQNGDEERGIYGKPTKWKLSQAITAMANDVGGSRKQELDEIAGKFLKM